jgi:hypothetical protein
MLEEIGRKILGAQQLAGKILVLKDLSDWPVPYVAPLHLSMIGLFSVGGKAQMSHGRCGFQQLTA